MNVSDSVKRRKSNFFGMLGQTDSKEKKAANLSSSDNLQPTEVKSKAAVKESKWKLLKRSAIVEKKVCEIIIYSAASD